MNLKTTSRVTIDEYQQSQKASRGEGHITRTAVEQQWESHLINDAEFTANTPLPSVTFDVNNSYVSQQLGQRVGEEVSHFYHPTPPSRNPSGFWQRLEQRYKNSFERQALIAEGRAAANSEVMRDRVRYEAANQQNYLDLGYSESIVETRVAEWMSPIVGAASPPVTKIPIVAAKAYGLMNKWGFFGHNEVENATTERFFHIASGASKYEIRQILRHGVHDLTPEQTRKVLQYLTKGTAQRVNLKIVKGSGEVRLSVERAGHVDGYQRMSYGIDIVGNTNKIVQTAFDDANNLIRQAPDKAKNNLYDVKKWGDNQLWKLKTYNSF